MSGRKTLLSLLLTSLGTCRRAVTVLASVVVVIALSAVRSGAMAQAETAATTPAPVVKSISLNAGKSAGGAIVTVAGSGFRHVSEVLFGAVPSGRVHVLSGGKLTAIAPRHAAGIVDVRVVIIAGGAKRTSAKAAGDRYAYFAPPAVTAVSPAAGVGGNVVTVIGTGFSKLTAVTFGGKSGTHLKLVSTGKLTVTAPKHAAGVVGITVAGEYGTSAPVSKSRYTYLDTTPPPPVSGLKVAATTSTTIRLSWTDPASGNYAGVIIRRAAGTVPPATPTSGTAVTNLAAPGKTWTDTGLSAKTTYSYALFAHNEAGYHAAAASVKGTTAPKPTCTPRVQELTGTLTTDVTWAPACATAYVVHDVDIPAGMSLTITAGTIVKMSGNMIVHGALEIAGTAADPVTITSVNDNSVGGKTGTGTPAAGAWGGIEASGPGLLDIEHARVEYASTGVSAATTGSVQLVDDDLSGVTAGGVDIKGGDVTVEGDDVTGSGTFPAYWVHSASLDLGQLWGNSASGGNPGFFLSGTVGVSSTWQPQQAPWLVQCGLDVPAAIAVTVAAGVVIKGTGTNYVGNGCLSNVPSVSVEGALDVMGTAASPVVFTSVNDSSAGGKTGTGTPAASDWGGIEVSGAGSLDLEHAKLSYAGTGVWGSTSGSVQLVDDDLSALGDGGVRVTTGDATVEDNDVVGSGTSPAYWVSSDALDFGQLWGNSASGGNPGFFLAGTVGGSSTWQPEQAPWLVQCGLYIPAAVTVTVAAGTIIKGTSTNYLGGGCASSVPSVTVEGTLDVIGTAASPVVFTSVNDSSWGGVTGTGTPAASDWGGIYLSGAGSLDLEHAKLSYASTGVWGSTSGSVRLLDDDLSTLGDGGVQVTAGDATVEDDDVVGSGVGPAYWVSSDALDFGQLFGNSASGGVPGFFLTGTVSVSSTWRPEQATWLLGTGTCGPIDIPATVTVTVAAGTVIKGSLSDYTGCASSASYPSVSVQGSLEVAGTATSPVVFTSVNDNSVGASTGTGTPAGSDWGGIEVATASGGTSVDHAVFEYASTAIAVDQLSALEVDNTQFSYNSAAFTVSSTPAVSSLLGQLDCAPPYTSFVTGSGDWFGATGSPGASTDIGSIVGLVIPAGLAKVWSAMSLLVPPAGVSDNAIGWKMYSCTEDFAVPIPVTPVVVSLAASAPFVQYAEKP